MDVAGKLIPETDMLDDHTRKRIRAIWEMARLHTHETWLSVFPAVWGASIGAKSDRTDGWSLAWVLFGIWASATVSHAAFCTWNDICDVEYDRQVERCKSRPLPSGLISVKQATFFFLCWMLLTLGTTWYTLGPQATLCTTPAWLLGLVYPFMKRVMPFPQLVVGLSVASGVLPGYVSVNGDIEFNGPVLALFGATVCWIIFLDTAYAVQDMVDDAKCGVQSLAVFLGQRVRLFLALAAIISIAFFVAAAFLCNRSLFYWIFGIGVWVVSTIRSISLLDLSDCASGGRVFKFNIKAGFYLMVVTLVEGYLQAWFS
ncbi:4-hydroxybenzoate octaprenyltransferase [Aspergillus neoniger CBS 115656]|uniref:UbiA prenyltransferase n=1 Tax=Aspergillus neoniger (strain CBS 115656) TaxID=1448310 RepID=A0A318Z5U5_ASPNB|nr:UbiA prenyltransferase [Aspergillus neoniger CBS 115656]PYH39100.1 UbiA prenyltransferase [Aspergillus neoniger CBS 115656]